jgi:hypothetical protein
MEPYVMSILKGRAYSILVSLIIYAIVALVIVNHNQDPPRPTQRKPTANELHDSISNSKWASGETVYSFSEGGHVWVRKSSIATWTALDGSVRLESSNGKVSYALPIGDELSVNGKLWQRLQK